MAPNSVAECGKVCAVVARWFIAVIEILIATACLLLVQAGTMGLLRSVRTGATQTFMELPTARRWLVGGATLLVPGFVFIGFAVQAIDPLTEAQPTIYWFTAATAYAAIAAFAWEEVSKHEKRFLVTFVIETLILGGGLFGCRWAVEKAHDKSWVVMIEMARESKATAKGRLTPPPMPEAQLRSIKDHKPKEHRPLTEQEQAEKEIQDINHSPIGTKGGLEFQDAPVMANPKDGFKRPPVYHINCGMGPRDYDPVFLHQRISWEQACSIGLDGTIPFALYVLDNGEIQISATIKGFDGSEGAEIVRNKVSILEIGWDHNSDYRGIEVVDGDGVPMLQVERPWPDQISIRGVFLTSSGKWVIINDDSLLASPSDLSKVRFPTLLFEYPSSVKENLHKRRTQPQSPRTEPDKRSTPPPARAPLRFPQKTQNTMLWSWITQTQKIYQRDEMWLSDIFSGQVLDDAPNGPGVDVPATLRRLDSEGKVHILKTVTNPYLVWEERFDEDIYFRITSKP